MRFSLYNVFDSANVRLISFLACNHFPLARCYVNPFWFDSMTDCTRVQTTFPRVESVQFHENIIVCFKGKHFPFSIFIYKIESIRFCGNRQYRRRRAIVGYHHRLTIISESNKERHNPKKENKIINHFVLGRLSMCILRMRNSAGVRLAYSCAWNAVSHEDR